MVSDRERWWAALVGPEVPDGPGLPEPSQTPTERRLLGIDSRTAALSTERIGCLNGIPTELRRTLVRGDRFAVSAEFSRTTGYRMAPSGALPGPPRTPDRRRPR